MTDEASDLDTLKAAQKATWTAGDYGQVAKGLEQGALDFLARIPVERRTRVLDVACGAGQAAIPLARSGALVTGIDIAGAWIEQARARAQAEGVELQLDVGDAESLPYDDGAFDLTLSLIGAMFAPRPERVAGELKRVTRPGGRIVMGNWPPQGFVAEFFAVVGKHFPPPPGVPSPLLWGDEDMLRRRFDDGIAELEITERPYRFVLPHGPEQVVDAYSRNFGPVVMANASLDDAGRHRLHSALVDLWSRHNTADDGTTAVTGNIIEVVALRE